MLRFDTLFVVQFINTALLVAILYLVYALLIKYPKRMNQRMERLEKRVEDIEKEKRENDIENHC